LISDFISSDPRRNKLIASDGDKDDRIDSGKLASLLRGGFLRKRAKRDVRGLCRATSFVI